MHKAQTVRARAFHEHVVHVIVATTLEFVVFLPVSAHTNNTKRVIGQRNDVRELNFGRIATLVQVFKARNVQIDQHFQQKHFASAVCRLNADHFVNRSLNLARINRRRLQIHRHIKVFASQNTLAELVGVHRNAMGKARTLRNDTRPVVRDVNVVGQAQFGHHSAQLSVVIDLLERRTTVSGVVQELIKLRCVLFHHRGDLVIHEILHTRGLLELVHGLFAQNLSADRAASRH